MLRQASNWSVVLAFLIGVFLIKKLSRDSHWILLLVAFACVPQVINAIAPSAPFKGVVYNIYTVSEFLIFYLLFNHKFKLASSVKIFKASLFAGFFVAAGFISFYPVFEKFISEWVCINNFIYLLWLLLYLREQMLVEENELNVHQSFTIYVIAILVYASTTIFYFSLDSYIKLNPESKFEVLYLLHDFLNIFLYLSFAFAFYKDAFKSQVKISR